MNKSERRILGAAIRWVRSQNESAWWDLKHQMFECGNQPYYHAQGDFMGPAIRAVSRLPPEQKDRLTLEWRKR